MKSKKNGFTLVELLAVIVILALVMILAIPAILRVINEARIESFYLYTRSLESKALARYQEDIQLLSSTNPEVENCAVYDIGKDFDLTNTGDYKGYVKMTREPADDLTKEHSFGFGDGVHVITGAHYCTYNSYTGATKCEPNKGISVDWSSLKATTYAFKQTTKDVINQKGDREKYYVCAKYTYGNPVDTDGDGRPEYTTNVTVNAGCTGPGNEANVKPIANGTYKYRMYIALSSRNYVLQNVEYNEDLSQDKFAKLLVSNNNQLDPTKDMVDCRGSYVEPRVRLEGNNTSAVIVTGESSTSTNYTNDKGSGTTSTSYVYVNTSSTTISTDPTYVTQRSSSSATYTNDRTTESKETKYVTVTTSSITTRSGVTASTSTTTEKGVTGVRTSENTQKSNTIVTSGSGTSHDYTSASGGTTKATSYTQVSGSEGTTRGSQIVTRYITDEHGSTIISSGYATTKETTNVSGQVSSTVSTQNVSIATTEEPKYEWISTTEPEVKSDRNLLSSLKLTPYTMTEEFHPNKYYYTVVVPYETTSVTVVPTLMEKDGTVEIFVNDAKNSFTVNGLKVGNNKITVKTFDTTNGNILYYRINVDRLHENGESVNTKPVTTTAPGGGEQGAPDPTLESSNANLRYILIYDQELQFDPNVTEYSAYLPEGASDLKISYEPVAPRATATLKGNENLQLGSTIEIEVVSENGYYRKTYKIKIADKKILGFVSRRLIPIIALLLFLLLLGGIYWWYKRTHKLIASRDEDEMDYNNTQNVPDQAKPTELGKKN